MQGPFHEHYFTNLFFRDIVKDALIFPDMMDYIMKADEEEKVMVEDKCRPPNNLKMLLNLATINLYPPFTADQVALFFAFIFPAFEEEKVNFFIRIYSI